MRRFIISLVVLILACQFFYSRGLPKAAKEAIKARYRVSRMSSALAANPYNIKELRTILVIERDGLGGSPDTIGPYGSHLGGAGARLVNGEITDRTGLSHPLVPGIPMGILFLGIEDDYVGLTCRTAIGYMVTRGIGAFKDTYSEPLSVYMRFDFPTSVMESGDTQTIFAAIDRWLRPFESQDDATTYSTRLLLESGKALAAASVREIKLGMTIAEVESVMGLPKTKADLGEKLIYRYEDMVVEFREGKVSDVRF